MKKVTAMLLFMILAAMLSSCTVNKSIDADVKVKMNDSEIFSYSYTDEEASEAEGNSDKEESSDKEENSEKSSETAEEK